MSAEWPAPKPWCRFVRRCRGRWTVAALHGWDGPGDYDCGQHFDTFAEAAHHWAAEELMDAAGGSV